MSEAKPESKPDGPSVGFVSATIKVEFDRFMIPNYARFHSVAGNERPQDLARFPATSIKDLPKEALHKLCGAWLDDVYGSAGLDNPWTMKTVVGHDCG